MIGKFVIDVDILYYETNYGLRIKMTGSPYAHLTAHEMSERFDEPSIEDQPYREPVIITGDK